MNGARDLWGEGHLSCKVYGEDGAPGSSSGRREASRGAWRSGVNWRDESLEDRCGTAGLSTAHHKDKSVMLRSR